MINSQPVRTELDTTTNMVVQDGQTIMLGGMLFQEDSRIKRKIPLLGDLPLVGGLFRHKQDHAGQQRAADLRHSLRDRYAEEMLPQVRRELDEALERLRRLEAELKPLREQDGLPADSNSPDPVPDSKPTPSDKTKETGSNSPSPAVETPAPDAQGAPDDKTNQTK